MTAIRIVGLSKSYPVGFRGRRARALENLNLTVESGEVLGYLGPNGSGKTTTLKILLGLVLADSGSATILGRPLDDRSWRFRTGYLPERPYFYDYLTPAEYLDYVGRLFGLGAAARRARAAGVLEQVGLASWARQPMRQLSRGLLQRVGLAQALLNEPDLLFLDEPMSGLDPAGRQAARDIILGLKRAGKTVFFSTHVLADAESLCDRVAVLDRGRLLSVGRIDEILGAQVARFEAIVSGLAEEAVRDAIPDALYERLGERCRLTFAENRIGDVIGLVARGNGRLLALNPIRRSLEEYFQGQLAGGAEKGTWGNG